jgi:hypothetical protein
MRKEKEPIRRIKKRAPPPKRKGAPQQKELHQRGRRRSKSCFP